MHILIAPDSFKENLSAAKVASAINAGVKASAPEATSQKIPMSDGGEGAIELLKTLKLGKIVACPSLDPLMRSINSEYFLFNDKKTAWIELSRAAGLGLLTKQERDPKITSTYGVGLLIKNAIEKGCKEIILGIGGSATNDAGSGLLSALGFKFLDLQNKILPQGGASLINLNRIEHPKTEELKEVSWTIACDVDNPLIGNNGAVAIYSKQKGASDKDMIILENSFCHFSALIETNYSKKIRDLKGGGSAGGIAAGMFGLLNIKIEKGFTLLSKLSNLEGAIKKADLIITAEGKIDGQTLHGKVPIGIASIAKKYNIPVVCIAGIIEPPLTALYEHGISGIFSIHQGPISTKESYVNSEVLIKNSTQRIIDFYKNILIL